VDDVAGSAPALVALHVIVARELAGFLRVVSVLDLGLRWRMDTDAMGIRATPSGLTKQDCSWAMIVMIEVKSPDARLFRRGK